MINRNILRHISLVNNLIHHRQSSTVRVRFAPSPTGYLHLGGLRTALYNYLFAKSNQGKFILRIEDTDQSRRVDGATEQLQEDLNWAGIEIDEGPANPGEYGPYIQSERLDLYLKQVNVLLDNGSAYHCFCTDKRLDLLRKEAVRARTIPKYDNRCRHMNKEEVDKRLNRQEKSCIRFKLTKDCETFEDLIYGNIAYDVALNEGDPVIMKSDGFPTYHFANVVDDHFMKITHVLRGVEWQISTTKHILMYRAFHWPPPTYSHLPLLLNPDGSKLSKRQSAIHLTHYRAHHILPLALLNYITHSGGGFPGKDRIQGASPRLYTLPQLTQQFDIGEVNCHSGRMMAEDRLLEFNRLELERRIEGEGEELEKLIEEVQGMVRGEFGNRIPLDQLNLHFDHIKSILKWSKNRINKLTDLVSTNLSFLWIIPNIQNASINLEKETIKKLKEELEKGNSTEFTKEIITGLLKKFSKANDINYSSLMKSLRTILSGLKEGPSVAEMMEILGKESTILRIQAACIGK